MLRSLVGSEMCIRDSIGIALNDQGKLEEAVDAYKRALSLKPDYADAYNLSLIHI